jgi:transcriptional regulator with XRE-family HTH domain
MSEKIQVRFGRIVREERLKTGQSQEKFAEKVGVHRTYIGMIERGEKNITIANIEKIANALNIPIVKLFEQIESS